MITASRHYGGQWFGETALEDMFTASSAGAGSIASTSLSFWDRLANIANGITSTVQKIQTAQNATGVVPPITSAPTPIYKKPWFWGAVGGGAALAVGAAILLRR